MLERDVTTAGIETRQIFNRSDTNVASHRAQRCIACNRAGGDVSATCCGDEVAANVFHRDVAAFGAETRRSANVTCENISPGCGDGEATVEVFRFDVPAASGEVDAVILRNVDFYRYPQTSTALATNSFAAQVNAVWSLARIHRKAFQETLCALLRRIGFESHAIIDLIGFLRVEYDIAEVGEKPETLAAFRGDGTTQLR